MCYLFNEQVKTRIVETFGDWMVISSEQNVKQVIWDFTDEGLGLHSGWVSFEDDDNNIVSDWGLEKEHDDSKHTVCIRDWHDHGYQVFLHPSGQWLRSRHYYTPKRAISLKNKHGGECLFWYQS